MFDHIPAYPGDPILSLNEDFKLDPRQNKVNLSIGIYFDDAGRLPVMDAVRRAETALLDAIGPRSYLPMAGLPLYRESDASLRVSCGLRGVVDCRGSGARIATAAQATTSAVPASSRPTTRLTSSKRDKAGNVQRRTDNR